MKLTILQGNEYFYDLECAFSSERLLSRGTVVLELMTVPCHGSLPRTTCMVCLVDGRLARKCSWELRER